MGEEGRGPDLALDAMQLRVWECYDGPSARASTVLFLTLGLAQDPKKVTPASLWTLLLETRAAVFEFKIPHSQAVKQTEVAVFPF